MSESGVLHVSSELISKVTIEKRNEVYKPSTESNFENWMEIFKSVSAGEKVKKNGTEFNLINAAEIMREVCGGFCEIRKGKKATPIVFEESGDYTFSISSKGELYVNLPALLELSNFSIDDNTVIEDEEGLLVFDGSVGEYAWEVGWEEAMHLDYYDENPDYNEPTDFTSSASYDASDIEYDALVKIYKKYKEVDNTEMVEITDARIRDANAVRIKKGKSVIDIS